MIGPHEGKELELMMAGEKHLAVFHDVLPDEGIIDEQIIPDEKFSSYVEAGKLERFEENIWSEKYQEFIKYVLFVLPDSKWRAEAYLDLIKQLHAKKKIHHENNDIFFGMLLDYTSEDIADFLEHQKRFITA